MKLIAATKKVILLVLTVTSLSSVASTNKYKVMKNLEKGWTVAYGDPIDYDDYIEFGILIKAAAACVAATSGAATTGCLSAMGYYLKHKLISSAERISDEITRESSGKVKTDKYKILARLVKALEKKQSFKISTVKVQAGMATYNHWKTTTYNEPRTYKCKKKFGFGWTWGVCSRTARVTKKIKFPNTFQPYMRYKIVRASSKKRKSRFRFPRFGGRG